MIFLTQTQNEAMKFNQALAGITLLSPLATVSGAVTGGSADGDGATTRRDRALQQIQQPPKGQRKLPVGGSLSGNEFCGQTLEFTNDTSVSSEHTISLDLIQGTAYTFMVERVTCDFQPVSALLDSLTLATVASDLASVQPVSSTTCPAGITDSGDPLFEYTALENATFVFRNRTETGCPAGGCTFTDPTDGNVTNNFTFRLTTTCDIPPPPCTAGCEGDPHFKTWRGQRFDFHGECDLVLLHSSAFESGLGLDVHIRTKIRRDMSYISSAALRIGSDVLEVESQGVYYLNGVAGAALPAEFSGFEFLHTQPSDKQHVFEVHLGGREGIKVKTYKDFVSVLIEQGENKHFGDSAGLMGDFQMGHMIARDGKTVIEDANAFGQEWQVLHSEPSLFQAVRLPQHPNVCTMPTPVQASQLRRRLSESSSVDELAAEKACAHWGEGKDDCVFDVLTTGDLEMAVVGAY
jgi:hypothetical protein